MREIVRDSKRLYWTVVEEGLVLGVVYFERATKVYVGHVAGRDVRFKDLPDALLWLRLSIDEKEGYHDARLP